MHAVEAAIVWVADLAQLTFEAASVLFVVVGGGAFVVSLLSRKSANGKSNPRLVLARYLIIALELQLAADIIATATHPSLEDIVKLAAIAVIRTFLNYFLVAELRAEKEQP